MSFAVNWPTFGEETETQLCSTLNELLKEAKMDANLIRGQFEVRGVSLGMIPPTITLMGVNNSSLDELSVEVCLQYDDQQCEGFAITIGGAEIALTGEADDPAFAPSKLWYPFEVTLYNIKIIAKAQIDVSLPSLRRTSVSHKPPPAFALHELQLGRLRAARTPVVPDERKVSTPSSSGRGPHYHQHPLTSAALKEVSLPRDTAPPTVSSTPQKVLKNTGFGFAYASRRVHYPKWPRTSDMNRQSQYCDASSTTGTVRSRSDNKVTPSQQSLSTNVGRRGMTAVPSLISLETSNSVGSYNPNNLHHHEDPPSGIPDIQSSLPKSGVSSPNLVSSSPLEVTPSAAVTISFSSAPRVDFFLRTNFRQLKGADEQTKSILMSLLRPKLEILLRGITINLPERTVELGPVGKPMQNMHYQHSP
eukprot:TRINITY_DN27807_c0_g1_i1.p1 TRINITY_DN27807_c0_g1~~TRINITY_DN27807_c0_g1_i1.p1  ORF type:complete len:435 (+),score=64.94 TRINITY_DN27807_c0_g1_i1:50-1306(+)